MTRALWVDASNGAAGDMLLAALLDAGASLDAVRSGLASLDLPISVDLSPVRRHGFRASHVRVDAADTDVHRGLSDVLAVLGPLPAPVLSFASAVFTRLAQAEARVHGSTVDDVHFHEVGALDAIADVAGCALALHDLRLLEGAVRVVSPVAVGSGTVRTAHGPLPVPAPAVAELLTAAGAPLAAHSATMELCTPTGAALLTTLATAWGPPPAMTPYAAGVGAGTADPPSHANVLRVLVGTATPTRAPSASAMVSASGPPAMPASVVWSSDASVASSPSHSAASAALPPAASSSAVSSSAASSSAASSSVVSSSASVAPAASDLDWRDTELLQVEATVDDLDPRIWPDLLEELRSIGAADAWCVPALMRKGRPGQVLTVLVDPARLDLTCRLVFTWTTTLGVRVHPVSRRALNRDTVTVLVAGSEVRVKRAFLGDDVVTAQPEYDDALAAARAAGIPVTDVLDAARAAASTPRTAGSAPTIPASAPHTPASAPQAAASAPQAAASAPHAGAAAPHGPASATRPHEGDPPAPEAGPRH
ncbi:nickel pincer cofactor biosynthesis protein LarC [Phytohabitans sp. ZYX-F-186]|uniref:Pyridinium-3,5-bisthiocarboxylic acid mononucleotide nickel insertion protein n=1 Tax=Phytohabitans maris TaxID=3071409 RepID=A0ABU0ZVF3_9ACTN|nr:nickel pincer cofactor biosynthesis protein LarC [Phytohabitans sp. ZYX-F-186]MDQ7911026.1 nickel pincer cofactor biosynthesis protein LarC [Phytohabitans sp. ZYX-F-186]